MRDVLKIRRSYILGLKVKDFKIVLDLVKTLVLEIYSYRRQLK